MIRLLSVCIIVVLNGCVSHNYYTKENTDSIDFFVSIPDAEEVVFVSSQDGFKRHLLVKENDMWIMRNVRKDTEFRFFFRVDGATYLPECRYREKDDFGGGNCVYQPRELSGCVDNNTKIKSTYRRKGNS